MFLTHISRRPCGLPAIIKGSKRPLLTTLIACLLLPPAGNLLGNPQDDEVVETRCIVVELYISKDAPQSEFALQAVQRLADERSGIRLGIRKVDESANAKQRLKAIAQHFKFDANTVPVIYACNSVIKTGSDADSFYAQLTEALKLEMFTRQGCKRCDAAKSYLPTLMRRYPAIQVVYREIMGDRTNQQQLNQLVRHHGKAASSTPVFHFCDELLIGFDQPSTTGVRIRQKLDRWTVTCPESTKGITANRTEKSAREVAARAPF